MIHTTCCLCSFLVWTKEKHSHFLTTIGKLTAIKEKKKKEAVHQIFWKGRNAKKKKKIKSNITYTQN